GDHASSAPHMAYDSVVGRLALLGVGVAGILDACPIRVRDKHRGLRTCVEVLVPREDGDHEHIALLEVVATVLDDRVALPAEYVICFFVGMTVGAGPLSRRDLGDGCAENLGIETELGVHGVRHPAHRGWAPVQLAPPS